jgi:hypothetical protein
MSEGDLTDKPGWKAVERWLKESDRPAAPPAPPISRARRLLGILAMIAVYPITYGPMCKLIILADIYDTLGPELMFLLYWPLLLLSYCCPAVGRAFEWYARLFVPR